MGSLVESYTIWTVCWNIGFPRILMRKKGASHRDSLLRGREQEPDTFGLISVS